MQIWLIISFLIFYVITRTVWVRIIKEECLKIELHLPLSAIKLSFPKEDDKKKSKGKVDMVVSLINAVYLAQQDVFLNQMSFTVQVI